MLNNKSLEIYKDLYSKYVDAHVSLHNYHIIFIKNLGLDSSIGVRKSIREISSLEKKLKQAVRDAYNEDKAIKKIIGKEMKKQKYRNTKGLGTNLRKKSNDMDAQQ